MPVQQSVLHPHGFLRPGLLTGAAALLLSLLTGCGSSPAEPSASVPHLTFLEGPTEEVFQRRWSAPSEPYLTLLRERYELDAVVRGAGGDYERLQRVSRWVRSRWEHNGDNVPHASDPLSILAEAATGRRFRCVEYSIVLSGALNSLGIPARVVGLKTADVETRASGAGHVVAEAYLHDQGKWVLVDGQWDVIPTLGGVPLNAVELQRALAERAPGLGVVSLSGASAREYFSWTAPYLFYFDAQLDHRFGAVREPGVLMLVPIGAARPRVFQRIQPLLHHSYTHSLAAFYAPPN